MNREPLVSVVVLTRNREKQVLRCINSILNSSYKHYEVIVVDNASTDRTCDLISEKFPQVKIIKSEKNILASGGRNLGASSAKGEYVLFVDSDNVIDKDMILHLVKVAIENEIAGLLGPKMYYLENPKMIWYAGADINLITSKTNYAGINTIDDGQFNEVKEVGHVPNVFMVKKECTEKVGIFDETYGIMLEEADLAGRIKRQGYKILFIPTAKVWHDVPSPSSSHSDRLRKFGLHSSERAYFLARNRIIYMKKFAPFINKIIFIIMFLPLSVFAYSFILLRFKKVSILKNYLKGTMDGLKIMLNWRRMNNGNA